MKVDKKYLSLAAACLGLVVFISIILGLIQRARHQGDADLSVAASAEALPAVAAASGPATAATAEGSTPSVFGATQDDSEGFDGHKWDATVGDIVGRRGRAEAGFTVDSKSYNGALDLPTIIWMGIGLPANHKRAQADTFDPASLSAAHFSTVQRGRTQYIFADGHFTMAVEGIDANDYERVRQKLATTDQEVPSLRTEQTFDLADAGSGLPPDTVSTLCFRKPNTNTRIYLVEKWSSSLLGAVTFHRVFVVYVPNASYMALLNGAGHAGQARP